nr:putative lipoprotein [Streptomyces ambofaciens ATCC 23877]CAI78308.1 putative lipoprotein [Streptomyces ambofaciens ATCC 23877]CAJ87813.1 putative lipoprotein [Streptomyces ambofaciens ATCC 23877]CAJ89091.1 putative lipoprotein [Streptomyces ambofaciens ATCC 23877]
MKASAIGVAAVMASAVLTGCGGDEEPKSQKAGTASSGSASASGDAGAQEQGTTQVRAAYDRTAEAETAKMTINMKLSAPQESITTDGKGALDFQEGDSVMTVTAQGKSIEQRVVDQVLYQKVPGQKAPGGKTWMKIDLKKAAQALGVNAGQIGDPAQSAAYAKAITDQDVTKVGQEKIDGVDTTHYKVSVDVAELPGGDQLRRQVGPTLPMQVWLDGDGRLRRQQLDMSVKGAPSAGAKAENSAAPQQIKMTMVMNYSDFGTEVEAQAPPAGQVADMTNEVMKQSRQQS